MRQMLIDWLPQILTVLLAALTWIANRYVKNATAVGIISRAISEARAAVSYVEQTSAGKSGEEKRKIAIDLAKSYIGPKGLAALGRILGGGSGKAEDYLETRVEEAVAQLPSTVAKVAALAPKA